MLALGLLASSAGAVVPPVALASDNGGIAVLDPPLLHAKDNSTAFLGAFWPDEEPQLVAISGASLSRNTYGAGKFLVVVYRAAPGMQVQVAIHIGVLPVLDTTVSGGRAGLCRE
jgi:hypothetical protein